MDAATREAVTSAAVRAAQAVDYRGAGTIEFIADASDGLKADRIWFMEMNTRLQVEHPVTEAITGVDLVEWQFRVAAGEPIPLKQSEIGINGWAMEARLYAEDPANGFLPSIGKLEHFRLPEKVRTDTGVKQGGEVSQFYDPMIAKIIVHTDTRKDTAAKLARKCREVEVWPVRTNAEFLARCLEDRDFIKGDVDTAFIGQRQEALTSPTEPAPETVAAAFAALAGEGEIDGWDSPGNDNTGPWTQGPFAFRLNAPAGARAGLWLKGEPIPAMLQGPQDYNHQGQHFGVTVTTPDGTFSASGSPGFTFIGDRYYSVYSSDDALVLFEAGAAHEFKRRRTSGVGGGSASDGALRAPMPGKIVAAPAKAGDTVTKGQPIIVLEAMKMEHALTAPFDGVVAELNAALGDQVGADAVLARIEVS